MQPYLAFTEIIDFQTPEVAALAEQLRAGNTDHTVIARRCFEWVRDEIRHSSDYRLNPVTCTASETLIHRTGYCYAKSHLLVALLRANGIPAAFCYQRLSVDDNGPPFCLHGLCAVHLPDLVPQTGWYRIDPRGNRKGIDAGFDPPDEHLAFTPKLPGEYDIPGYFAEPLPSVVRALRTHHTWDAMLANLPDVDTPQDQLPPSGM